MSATVTKHALFELFDRAVSDAGSYQRAYAYDIRAKNYLVFQRTTVANYVVGWRADGDLVLLPIEEADGGHRAGTPVPITRATRSVFKRDPQKRWLITSTDGARFRLQVVGRAMRIMGGGYVLPVEQAEEAAAWAAFADSQRS